MPVRQSIKAEFLVVVDVVDVYGTYVVDAPDANNMMMSTLNAILDVGISPVRVELQVNGKIGLLFADWMAAVEAEKAIGNVMELLWLSDNPDEPDLPDDDDGQDIFRSDDDPYVDPELGPQS